MIPTQSPIYLDHNATTPLLPEVLESMLPYFREHFGNPSSAHIFGQTAREAVDRARSQVASLLGADPEEIIFTSGGTEANNLAICGVADTETGRKRRTLITSAIEHPATANVCAWLEQRGYKVHRLPVDKEGRVDPEGLDPRLLLETALLTIMHSNNETGVLQPIASLSSAARAAGALIHTDAAQSVGKVPIDVRTLDIDLLSVAGHKLYAPKGVGALFARRGVALSQLMRGASHESGRRPGTENVAGIVGLGTACEIARRDRVAVAARVAELRQRLWQLLQQQVPGIHLNGHPTERLPNTLNVSFPGVSGNALLHATPRLCASTGSACHDGHDVASPVLQAMRLPLDQAVGAVRLTLGRSTSEHDIEHAAALLSRSWASLRRTSA